MIQSDGVSHAHIQETRGSLQYRELELYCFPPMTASPTSGVRFAVNGVTSARRGNALPE
jgi:hypothetical protein